MSKNPLSASKTFAPYVIRTHQDLIFAQDDDEVQKSEGFWQEFFLLKPDPKSFHSILSDLSADDLLHLQAHPQQLVIRAVARIKAGVEPSDENALDVGFTLVSRHPTASAQAPKPEAYEGRP
jgi:hypothetical protein